MIVARRRRSPNAMPPELASALARLPTEALNRCLDEAMSRVSQKKEEKKGWCPHAPHEGPQSRFVKNQTAKEILYGGAAGGGKTDALLMAALEYVHVPGYAAIIFRRTFPQLNLPDGLIERSHQWLNGTGARYHQGEHRWKFPSGATLTFAQLQYAKTKYEHHGAAYQFLGWDELTQFTQDQYTYLFSRLRRPSTGALSEVPLRCRAGSNPGDIGHVWVKNRFLSLEAQRSGRLYIPANVKDNPALDAASYLESLGELDPVSRARLLAGDWDVDDNCLVASELVLRAQTPNCLWPFGVKPASAKRRGELFIGVDIGRTKDLTVIWTWERIGDVLWCRNIEVLEGEKFSVQKEAIRSSIDRDVIAVRIDKGGIGMQLAEELEEEFPAIVEGVQLTGAKQGQLAKLLQTDFVENRIRIPEDRELQEDIQLVRKISDVGGVPKVLTMKGEVGHGDRFWAAALGRFAVPYELKRTVAAPRGASTQEKRTSVVAAAAAKPRGPIRGMSTRKH